METHLNLEFFQLDNRKLDVVDEGAKRVLKTRRNKTQEVSRGINISRIDGKTATFFFVFEKEFLVMCVH
ncbi:hypothetical protein CRE_09783 [Caenorhabditis remanei]|uniref:Uncharacterized protein n=1 Tax=Caenorhabditis remanei TaxID=31234 RepID=E3NDE5_CAERE|nr:hypothetical protein CRE_09783 [Caenorhabditis remanei]